MIMLISIVGEDGDGAAKSNTADVYGDGGDDNDGELAQSVTHPTDCCCLVGNALLPLIPLIPLLIILVSLAPLQLPQCLNFSNNDTTMRYWSTILKAA